MGQITGRYQHTRRIHNAKHGEQGKGQNFKILDKEKLRIKGSEMQNIIDETW